MGFVTRYSIKQYMNNHKFIYRFENQIDLIIKFNFFTYNLNSENFKVNIYANMSFTVFLRILSFRVTCH